jgi:hypothetical protein
MTVHVGDYIENRLNGLIHEVVEIEDRPGHYCKEVVKIQQVGHKSWGEHHLAIPSDSLDEYWKIADPADVARLMLWYTS